MNPIATFILISTIIDSISATTAAFSSISPTNRNTRHQQSHLQQSRLYYNIPRKKPPSNEIAIDKKYSPFKSHAAPQVAPQTNLSNGVSLRKNYSPFKSRPVIADPLGFIQSEIASADVVIFSTTNCPHCTQTKNLFHNNLQINPKIIELDRLPNGLGPNENSIAVKLYQMTSQRTVPNVFIRGRHMGGNEEVWGLYRRGELERLLV